MAKEFIITAPHFIQQVHQMEPQYVDASVSHQAKIMMPDDFVPSKSDRFMFAVEAAPEKPRPAHVETKREAARKSHEPSKLTGRAADS